MTVRPTLISPQVGASPRDATGLGNAKVAAGELLSCTIL